MPNIYTTDLIGDVWNLDDMALVRGFDTAEETTDPQNTYPQRINPQNFGYRCGFHLHKQLEHYYGWRFAEVIEEKLDAYWDVLVTKRYYYHRARRGLVQYWGCKIAEMVKFMEDRNIVLVEPLIECTAGPWLGWPHEQQNDGTATSLNDSEVDTNIDDQLRESCLSDTEADTVLINEESHDSSWVDESSADLPKAVPCKPVEVHQTDHELHEERQMSGWHEHGDWPCVEIQKLQLIEALEEADDQPYFPYFEHLPPELQNRIITFYLEDVALLDRSGFFDTYVSERPLPTLVVQPPISRVSRALRDASLALFYMIFTVECHAFKGQDWSARSVAPCSAFKRIVALDQIPNEVFGRLRKISIDIKDYSRSHVFSFDLLEIELKGRGKDSHLLMEVFTVEERVGWLGSEVITSSKGRYDEALHGNGRNKQQQHSSLHDDGQLEHWTSFGQRLAAHCRDTTDEFGVPHLGKGQLVNLINFFCQEWLADSSS